MVGVLAVGFIAGVIVELGIDSGTIKALQSENERLALENEQIRKEPEVIEIVDRRAEPNNYFTPF